MYVCMYVRMHACKHACMHACMYVCIYVCIYVCMYVWSFKQKCSPVVIASTSLPKETIVSNVKKDANEISSFSIYNNDNGNVIQAKSDISQIECVTNEFGLNNDSIVDNNSLENKITWIIKMTQGLY